MYIYNIIETQEDLEKNSRFFGTNWIIKTPSDDIDNKFKFPIQNYNYDTHIMINFRQLLWYWQEYYMRRGRDRLSLEFSSHITFHHWQNVVGMYVYVS